MARAPYAHLHADPEAKAAVLARQAARRLQRELDPNTTAMDDERGIGRGRLASMSDVMRFVKAGNATLTIVSKKTGVRFTYKLQRPAEDHNYSTRKQPIFVRLLNKSDNSSEDSYAFLGTIWLEAQGLVYRHSPKSRTTRLAPSVKAIEWFAKELNGTDLLNLCEVWHEGRCGRCGRKLTVPESINNGFGPECINHV